MKTLTPSETMEEIDGEFVPGRSTRRNRWVIVASVIVVLVAITLGVVDPFSTTSHPASGVLDNSAATSLQTVTRRDLSSQTQVDASLGYAGSYSVVNQAQGTITSLPSIGQTVRLGQVLYQVNGSPVVLLYGTTPAYRTLSEGSTDSATRGADVGNLNYDLVALGYLTSADIASAPNDFTSYTKEGVEKLQAALGVTQNGALSLGDVVFLPSAIRITAVPATLGGPAGTGQSVATATSTSRQVTIDLNTAQQTQVAVGDRVTITLPNNQTTPGVVSSVGTVATAPASGSSSTSPTVTVEVTPSDPAATGTWDQAPVEVSITTGSVKDALVVPVDSLLALAGGGYALEIVGSNGVHRLVPVTLGVFDDADGLVSVTGSGLSAGQHVVVPAA